ncbi:hypothetical protein JRG42_12530 [Pseudomonas granadensis]|uniref:hypothetical protein n=1 Tax=Pseudomonas granadensis TaxID=1421430 RepID=UPI0019D1897D|nr:hypothetical protein [Pseudomonas granadensis]MBN6774207.1 hypothetical protein [Pseudomonas granadensis]MBN6805319.1 hypothetical protein [Pseudomonas granadensis]MBN6832233.1 hypothetical protein [Pseudomonas granadensis]MBN6839513.1 hypothetical protein [Pseudomonas granadensis]MBN6868656.1 hypothetical protein [Pseudomonas granadensis]
MELLRALTALSIVLSIIGFWVYKYRHFLLLTPLLAPLTISALHFYCAYWIFFKSTSFWGLFVAYGAAQVSSRPVHSVLNRIDLIIVQKRRDKLARDRFDSGLTIPFALYLRPFATTDRLNFSGLSTKWGGVDLESLIASACRPWGLLIGLGRKGDAVGAGKLCCSDRDWEEMFFRLSEKAESIIVVPGVSKGSFFEIEWIMSHGFLAKTTFLMPPTTQLRMSDRAGLAFTSNHCLGERDYAKNWENVRVRLRALEILLPPYEQCGSLIQFCGDEGLYSQYMFGSGVPSIKQVLVDRLSNPALR